MVCNRAVARNCRNNATMDAYMRFYGQLYAFLYTFIGNIYAYLITLRHFSNSHSICSFNLGEEYIYRHPVITAVCSQVPADDDDRSAGFHKEKHIESYG